MNNIFIRKDHQRVNWQAQLVMFAVIVCLTLPLAFRVGYEFIYMIVPFIIVGLSIVYLITYKIYVKKKQIPFTLDESKEAFYESKYQKNKLLKTLILCFRIVIIAPTMTLIYYLLNGELYEQEIINVLNGLYICALLFSVTYIIFDVIDILKKDRIKINKSASLSNWYNKIFLVYYYLLSSFSVAFISGEVSDRRFNILSYIVISAILLYAIPLVILYLSSKYYSRFEIVIKEADHDLEEIGEGKHAFVYKKYDVMANTTYALKKLKKEFVNKEKQRFVNEYKCMKEFNHQNLLQVYDFDDEKMIYTMQYIPYTLQQYLEENKEKIDIHQRLNLINQFLDGMAYLHNKGVYHRDLSFTNVLIDSNGILKISDFGLCKNPRNNYTSTLSEIKGSYKDPALEKWGDYTTVNDIYSMASIINYMYYGRQNIELDNSNMSKILKKCMDLDIKNRYHTVEELAKDFRTLIENWTNLLRTR